MKRTILIAIIILSILPSYSQELKIIRIIDSNLFELDNSERIRLAGIDIPRLNSQNEILRGIAEEAKKYIEKEVLRTRYVIRKAFPEHDSLGNTLVFIDMLVGISSKSVEVNKRFLEKGFGKLLNNFSIQNIDEYKEAERDAKNNNRGIWKYYPVYQSPGFSNNDQKETFVATKIQVRPLIALSVVSFALSYDYLKDASLLQDGIDDLQKSIIVEKSLDQKKLYVSLKEEAEAIQTRKRVLGIGFIIVGVINTVFSFEEIKVETISDGVQFSYRF